MQQCTLESNVTLYVNYIVCQSKKKVQLRNTKVKTFLESHLTSAIPLVGRVSVPI